MTTTTTLYNLHGNTSMNSDEQIPSAPPSTPSNQAISHPTDKTDPFLSSLLNRLTIRPLLPLRRKLKTLTLAPPLISLASPNKHLLLSAATEFGFFHISDSNISQSLHESYLLRYKSDDEKTIHLHDTNGVHDSYTIELRNVVMKVLELLGFKREITTKCSMRVSSMEKEYNGYPYILSLQYDGRERTEPSWIMNESGEWVAVGSRDESILVTLGEIAQVWSNGQFKKVRSLPRASSPVLKCRSASNNTSQQWIISYTKSEQVVEHEDDIDDDVTQKFV